MTPEDRFGRTLSTWLREEAEHKVPDHLAEVLVQTVATRQRPWWSSPERLLPMTTMTTGRVTTRPPVFWFALLALLALAVVGATLLAGSLRSTPTPLGPASNGRIVVVDASTITTYAPDGTDPRKLATIGGIGSFPSISPDGTRVAVMRNSMPPAVHVVSLEDGTASEIPVLAADLIAEEPMGWSPDGRSLVLAGLAGGQDVMFIVDTRSGTAERYEPDGVPSGSELWLPTYSPDGEWIAFGAVDKVTSHATLYVAHPDGTGLRELSTPSLDIGDGGGPVWAPTTDARRIAYLTFSNNELQTHVYDLDTDTDTDLGPGFWPSWSPDGTRLATCCATIVNVDDAIAGTAVPVTAFDQPDGGNCGDHLDMTGRAICSAAAWSPDGQWLIGADIALDGVLVAPVDGSQPPRRIDLGPGTSFGGFRIPVSWQPVWP